MEGKEVPKAVQAVEKGGVKKNWRRLIFGEKIHTSHLMQGSKALASNPQSCLLSINETKCSHLTVNLRRCTDCKAIAGPNYGTVNVLLSHTLSFQNFTSVGCPCVLETSWNEIPQRSDLNYCQRKGEECYGKS